MGERDYVSVGKRCEKCGKDKWYVYQGHNRCECGQYLWIEKYHDGPGLRFRASQGAALPADYKGWQVVTGGYNGERIKQRQCRWKCGRVTTAVSGICVDCCRVRNSKPPWTAPQGVSRMGHNSPQTEFLAQTGPKP